MRKRNAYLVGREAVVELNNSDLIPTLTLGEPSFLEHPVGAVLGHLVPDNVHGTARLKSGRTIGSKSLGHDFDGLVLKTTSTNEVFRGNNAARGTVLEV